MTQVSKIFICSFFFKQHLSAIYISSFHHSCRTFIICWRHPYSCRHSLLTLKVLLHNVFLPRIKKTSIDMFVLNLIEILVMKYTCNNPIIYRDQSGGRRDRDRMVVGYTTTCAINAYLH